MHFVETKTNYNFVETEISFWFQLRLKKLFSHQQNILIIYDHKLSKVTQKVYQKVFEVFLNITFFHFQSVAFEVDEGTF